MSTVTQISADTNGSQQVTNYETSKLLHGANEFTSGTVTAVGSNVTLTAGLVIGRIASTRLLVACDEDATDGSQLPVGICIVDQVVTAGTSAVITLVNKGRVNESLITFSDGGLDSTAVGPTNNTKTYRDWLNDLGLVLEVLDELTGYDNYTGGI